MPTSQLEGQKRVAVPLSAPAPAKIVKNQNRAGCISWTPNSSHSKLGKLKIAQRENTINCQARSCGRLAPNSAIVGQKLVMAAAKRSGTTQGCGGELWASASTISVTEIA